MTIDLTHARDRVVERIMGDACLVTRVPLGTQTYVLNESTGALSPPGGIPLTVYSGICHVTQGGAGPSLPQTMGLEGLLNSFTVRLPWNDGNDIEKGDYCTVTACEDPTLEGIRLKVTHVVRTSLSVTRELVCELLESNRDG